MKNFICKYAVKLGSVMATALTVNTTCVWFSHQEKLPETAKKLRKF